MPPETTAPEGSDLAERLKRAEEQLASMDKELARLAAFAWNLQHAVVLDTSKPYEVFRLEFGIDAEAASWIEVWEEVFECRWRGRAPSPASEILVACGRLPEQAVRSSEPPSREEVVTTLATALGFTAETVMELTSVRAAQGHGTEMYEALGLTAPC